MAKTPMYPMTKADMMAYAIKALMFADRMEKEGDLYSKEVNLWMANNYLQAAMKKD